MNESFGSTFMFRILVIFIVFFICFECFAVNYAKTFRIKNGVVNRLEQYRYDGSGGSEAVDVVRNYLEASTYNPVVAKASADCSAKGGDPLYTGSGVCIIKNRSTVNDVEEIYYRVYLYITYKIPVLGTFVMPVGGETDVIV